jgi:hypothetical protein
MDILQQPSVLKADILAKNRHFVHLLELVVIGVLARSSAATAAVKSG